MDIYDYEERQDLDKYKGEGKGEGEDVGYISFPFIALPLPP